MPPEQLYAAMVAFVRSRGYEREEPGSGWWFSNYGSYGEWQLGELVEDLLVEEGIDVREEPA